VDYEILARFSLVYFPEEFFFVLAVGFLLERSSFDVECGVIGKAFAGL